MRALILGVLILVASTACSEQPTPQISEHSLIVSNRVTLAGELNPAEIESLRTSGTLVIDLRTDATAIKAEAALLQRHNVSYRNLPVEVSEFELATVHAFQQLLADSNDAPVVVHCSSGNRAGLLWAAHLLEQGETLQGALTAVQHLTTKPGVVQTIEDYANDP